LLSLVRIVNPTSDQRENDEEEQDYQFDGNPNGPADDEQEAA
jgi:hypothetical protein